MSGICGIVKTSAADEPFPVSDLEAMAAAARHRGPDGIMLEVLNTSGMGYLSFEVTPESVGEVQPVIYKAAGIMAVASLRLDNRAELIGALGRELRELGKAEAPPTDAELLVAARLKWPDSFVERLMGDFAIAICDPRQRTLQLARDPMGIRPLYFHVAAHRLLFASEIKQILAVPGVKREINERSVAAQLCGFHPPAEFTFFQGIDQVGPGEILTLLGDTVTRRRFWEVSPEPARPFRSAESLRAEFRTIFLDAVKCRVRCASPIAISLSGGLDSGSIASVFGWLRETGRLPADSRLNAYSWAFEELVACDERKNSSEIADRYGIPMTGIPGDDAWPLADLHRNRPDLDDPYIFYYHDLIDRLLAAAKRDNSRMLLTGERGDAVTNQWVYDYPGLLKSGRLCALYSELSAHGKSMELSLTRMIRRSLLNPLLGNSGIPRRYARMRRRRSQLPAYVRSDFASRAQVYDLHERRYPASPITNEARRLRYELIFSSTSFRRISLIERHQAAHGLGFADPWSDRRIAEFVVSIPQHEVHRFLDYKRLTRRGLKGILPERLQSITRLEANADPASLFDRGIYDRSRDTVRSLIIDSIAAEHGFVDKNILRDDYEAALSGKHPPYELWWFLTLELWLREHWR